MSRARDEEPRAEERHGDPAGGEAGSRPAGAARPSGGRTHPGRVPVEELVDLDALRARGAPVTPRALREALPRGWALEDDGLHAHKDARLLFREGWILICGLFVFGSVGAAFLWGAVPRGWGGVLRLALSLGLVLLLGGLLGPLITRSLNRR